MSTVEQRFNSGHLPADGDDDDEPWDISLRLAKSVQPKNIIILCGLQNKY